MCRVYNVRGCVRPNAQTKTAARGSKCMPAAWQQKKWLSNAFICAGAKLFQVFSNVHCGEELSGTVKCKKAISIILYNSLKWKPFFENNLKNVSAPPGKILRQMQHVTKCDVFGTTQISNKHFFFREEYKITQQKLKRAISALLAQLFCVMKS